MICCSSYNMIHFSIYRFSPSDVKMKHVKEYKQTNWSVPDMCRRHRSLTELRRSIQQEDLFN